MKKDEEEVENERGDGRGGGRGKGVRGSGGKDCSINILSNKSIR